jgi:hypothetical protein
VSEEPPVDRAKYREYAVARQWPGNPYIDLARMIDIDLMIHSLCLRRISQFFKPLGNHFSHIVGPERVQPSVE